MADRKSLLERRAALEGRREQLEAAVAPAPTEVHRQTVEVMSGLLELGKSVSGENTPPALKTMLRMFERSKPLLISQLAAVPPKEIVAFMKGLEEQMHKITSASDTPITAAPEQEAS